MLRLRDRDVELDDLKNYLGATDYMSYLVPMNMSCVL
jgi:hypothetical protein